VTAPAIAFRRRPLRRTLSRGAMYAIAIGVVLVVLVPIIYAVLGGFRTTGQISARPVDLPHPWVFENYREIITSDSFWRQVGNSVLIAAITMAVVVPCASLAAFVLARFSFRGREAVYIFFTFGLLFPVAVAILPLFISLRTFGLINSWFGVALPQAAFALPTTIIVLRPFFRSVPAELEEAAAIDGCGPFRFFWKILLPLSRPVLATVSVIVIVASWNAFLLPLIVLNDPDLWTLPLGVTNFSTQYSSDTARVLAFTSLSMVPALVFYVFAERQIVSGLAAGAVRG
jgi:raffinose/stachyose/melibiose transport system permease protein